MAAPIAPNIENAQKVRQAPLGETFSKLLDTFKNYGQKVSLTTLSPLANTMQLSNVALMKNKIISPFSQKGR